MDYIPSFRVSSTLPATAPQNLATKFPPLYSDVSSQADDFTAVPSDLRCLQQLCINPMVPKLQDGDLLRRLGPSLQQVFLYSDHNIFVTVKSVLRNLTHLELSGAWDDYHQETPVFESILCHGIHLESLRVKGHVLRRHSVSFRNHPGVLPALRHFGVYFTQSYVRDKDLFPAICDFLRNRSQLESLELISPHSRVNDIGRPCWNILSEFPYVRKLAITIPHDKPSIPELIPSTIQTLVIASQYEARSLEEVIPKVQLSNHIRQYILLLADNTFELGSLAEGPAISPVTTLHNCECGSCTDG